MRVVILLIFSISIFACSKEAKKQVANQEKGSKQVVESDFQTMIDSARVQGSILIYDLDKDTYYSNDFEWAKRGQLPASTFKIVNSIVGLETGLIEGEGSIFKWDGEDRWLDLWEQDLVLRDAFQFSCVPCYQELARGIGAEQMKSYIEKLQYGNLDIDEGNIDQFWLRGLSRITQFEQIDFLKRLYSEKLPISARTFKIVKEIMRIDDRSGDYSLYGKTGLSNEDDHYNGWFVGYIEQDQKVYFFASNLEPTAGLEINQFIPLRKELTEKAFLALKSKN